jgi:hypothetical protein
MTFSHHKQGHTDCSKTSVQLPGSKSTASLIIQMGAILILFVLLTPSTGFSYTVLWDTSHGVYVSGTTPQ